MRFHNFLPRGGHRPLNEQGRLKIVSKLFDKVAKWHQTQFIAVWVRCKNYNTWESEVKEEPGSQDSQCLWANSTVLSRYPSPIHPLWSPCLLNLRANGLWRHVKARLCVLFWRRCIWQRQRERERGLFSPGLSSIWRPSGWWHGALYTCIVLYIQGS